MTDTDPSALLKSSGVEPDESKDQYFLMDGRVLDRAVEYAEDIAPEATSVLEIGGGTGSLTSRLVDMYDDVTVIEKDPELVRWLGSRFDVDVVRGDFLETEVPEYDVSVSNLPYSASSPILFELLPMENPAVLMLQKEFADRLVAEPGTDDYGRLSVTAGHYAESEIAETVPRTAFKPQPDVESALVTLTPREPDYRLEDHGLFVDLLRGVFTQRRKTLRNAVQNTVHITDLDCRTGLDRKELRDALPSELAGKRPGKITPAGYAELANLFAEKDDGTDK
ncbi:MAG: 16S rRNA (adenine(1518)-N(6)/adenine(1519)-N(6))-dimethyltransferase RsmA [Halobacteria archaeon]